MSVSIDLTGIKKELMPNLDKAIITVKSAKNSCDNLKNSMKSSWSNYNLVNTVCNDVENVRKS